MVDVKKTEKPFIESLINTCALALTSFGVLEITAGSPRFPLGYLAIAFGFGLEFWKYWGRKYGYW